MGNNYITLIKDNLNAANLSIFFFVIACLLTVFYFIRKAANEHIAKIVSTKKAKELLISQLTESLETIHRLNDKLVNQKEVLDSYEEDTLKEALATVRNVRSKYGIFSYLNNPELVKEIIFYYDGKLKLLEEMLELEEGSYNFQIEYHQKLLQFNRDLEHYKSDGNNTEEVIEYKRNILNELDKIRTQVSASLTNLKSKREEYYTELKNSQNMVIKLMNYLRNYKHRELDSKKFYPRYLAFV
ncbi:hypothetical protein GYA27_03635 [candidate division WWE3 bacterium]|uniref:Uncharacterized protein n=1 Tax=candidate division WWE3 bacterium TaxID=2053526 RepID=A0A7X9HGU4_UNCKA|nr:hypothetical protein [candidate division WWE3 bacterium]